MKLPVPVWAQRLAGIVAMACAAGLALGLPAGAGAFSWQFPMTSLQAGPDGSDQVDVAVAPDGTTTMVYRWQFLQFSWLASATRPAGQGEFIYSDVSIPLAGSDARPRIAVSPDGTTTVVWEELGNNQVWAATRPPGQASFPDPTQTPPQRLSDPSFYSTTPEVTAADDGSVTAVWDEANASLTERRVRGATRPPGHARFNDPEYLSIPGSINHRTPPLPQVAAAADGTTTVVWSRSDDADVGTIQVATRLPGQSGFPDPAQTPPQDVSAPGEDARYPEVAFGANRQATVVWEGQGVAVKTVESATRQPGASTFEGPEEIADHNGPTSAKVAYSPDGQTTVVWGYGEIFSSTRAPRSRSWGTPESISGPTGSNTFPKIVVASDGRATVVWQGGWTTPVNSVLSATRPGGPGGWSGPEVLDGDAGDALFRSPAPEIAVAPDGRATVAWTTWPGPAIVTIDSDATRYALEVRTDGTGSGTVTSGPSGINCGVTCSSSFPLSTPVELTANAGAGSSFAGWGGACSGSARTCTVRILGNRSVTATFTKDPPGPAPDPVPSNGFTTKPSTVRGSAIITRVSVPGAGTITQRATYGSRRASALATRTACTASRTATKAGTYTLVCRLNSAAREQRRKGTLRLRLRLQTTFTPSGGTARSSVRTVLLRSPTLPVVG